MVEPSERGLALGKQLAHVDKEVRDQAVAAIQQLLAQDDEFTYMEMLRHWKALFYCFWLSDKPLVQQELSWSLAGLVLGCKGGNRAAFVRAFWDTLCREWFHVDKHRIDKYLLLVRRMVFFTLQSMRQSGWDGQLVAEFADVLQQFPINPKDPRVPNSIRSHVADVYLDELVRLAGEASQQCGATQAAGADIPVATLLEPFMRAIATTTIRHMPQIIQESVFESLVVRIAEAEESHAGLADSDDQDEAGEDAKDNQILNETLARLQFLADSISDIKKRMLAVGGEETTTASGRRRLYVLYQALCDTFPDESDVVFAKRLVVKAPVGAEERKASDKRKRKRESKTRERKEKSKRDSDAKRNIVTTAAAEVDANALEREATADEERGYQQDIAKIRAMMKRAGLAELEGGSSKPASKKAKRTAKKKQSAPQAQAAGVDEVPLLVPIEVPVACGAVAGGAVAASPKADLGAWVVRDKGAGGSSRRPSQPDSAASLLSETEKTIVVRDRVRGPEGSRPAGSSAAAAGGHGKRKLTWALEHNSVKQFLKKVPMLPSPAPVPEERPALPKPVLRKKSAYGRCDLPLPPAQPPAKRAARPGVRRRAKKAAPRAPQK
ncbi:hypothetical protein IWQ57_005122 [Coemansia nantahalensis]|uniref:Uncharacterized protein n=1 Tax=Coemansia nantahalensis TaxID=2789366 RepID=A0ACC1JPH8_9FUNG|nr:hypothetical protein IWQ57_005122 [Coemansia nantahalensis]